MLIHLSNIVQRGIIDNSKRGVVDVELWYDHDAPSLHYVLDGDCSPDIAGCKVSFSNRVSVDKPDGDWEALHHLEQHSSVLQAGDITLSLLKRDENNAHMLSHVLSIEFYADTRFRVLIELDYFDFTISLPQWSYQEGEANLVSLLSRDLLRAHINTCVELYSKYQMSLDSDDFQRCHWDDILNRAESRSAIFRTIRNKYYGEDNSLTSTSYVLSLPQILGSWIREDRYIIPSNLYDNTRMLTLFDYLEQDHRHPVHIAMQHKLFYYTNELTQLISANLQRRIDSQTGNRDEIEELMQKYSRIVSRILATILLYQQERDEGESRSMLLGRIKHLLKRVDSVNELLPADLHDKSNIRVAMIRLRHELNNFRSEIQR